MKHSIIHKLEINVEQLKGILRNWARQEGVETESIQFKLSDISDDRWERSPNYQLTSVEISGYEVKKPYPPANLLDDAVGQPYN